MESLTEKRILYIYPGEKPREGVGLPWKSQHYGLEELPALGFHADALGRDDALPERLRTGFLSRLLGFRLRHLLLFFKARSYDVVFGAALVYLMPLKKILGGRARYVALNIELVRMLRANERRPFRHWFIKEMFKEFSAVVCLSRVQEAWLLTRCSFLQGKTHVVLLGADTTFHLPVYEGRTKTVLSVGGDSGRDYATLIKTARHMPDTYFLIVCSRRNLAGIGLLPENVEVGYDIPGKELVPLYQSAACLVLATHDDTYADGSDCSGQTVLLDAMASGLPIIATQKAYLKDYVEDGKEACIVAPYDPDALQGAITSLLEDPTQGQMLARNARLRAETHLSTRTMAEGLVEVFSEVVKHS